jgi:TRAP-type C4-dicarboxylate transport system substrate-binding protein
MAPLYGHGIAWADKITEMTGGRLTFVHYAAGALVPMDEYQKAIQVGTMDLMHIGTGNEDYHPSSSFTRLPYLGLRNMRMSTDICNAMYDIFPEIREEYDQYGMLYSIASMPPDMLHMAKKEVRVPADLKGTKVSAGPHIAAVVEAAGGAPVEIQLPDWYMSLESGLIDGVWDHFAVVDAFGVTPLFKHHTYFVSEPGDVTAGGSSIAQMGITFNWDSWNSLPPDIQDIIMSLREWYIDGCLEMDVGALEKAMANAVEAGAEFTYCTPEEVEQWKPLGQPLYDKWLANMAKLGKPGEEILAEVKRLIAEYE